MAPPIMLDDDNLTLDFSAGSKAQDWRLSSIVPCQAMLETAESWAWVTPPETGFPGADELETGRLHCRLL